MSDDNMTAAFGFPGEFYCEHSSSKSRVMALVSRDALPSTLHAVLTCTDQLLAHRAASILALAAHCGRGEVLDAEATRVAESLPAAPAASFRQALGNAYAARWPIPDAAVVSWGDVHDSYDYELTDDQPVSPGDRDGQAHTPSDARLADLQGPVFRLTNLLEIHVHDAPRMLAAAAADGWEPAEADQAPDSRDNLLDAAMHLVDGQDLLPGAEIVTAIGSGERLDPDLGDEVADWSEAPIKASFGTGWRVRSD